MDFYTAIHKHYDDIFPLQKAQVEFVRQSHGTTSGMLLDAGCATGSLAIELARSGFQVHGIDLDPFMIELAFHKNNGKNEKAIFQQGNMLSLNFLFANGLFDGVICFGNTLVHLDSFTEIQSFLSSAFHLLKDSGKLMIQILNYDYIVREQITSLPLIDNEVIRFERSYDYLQNGKIEFTTRLLIKEENQSSTQCIELLPVTRNELSEMLTKAGFTHLEWYGSFARTPLENNSLPLVVLATK